MCNSDFIDFAQEASPEFKSSFTVANRYHTISSRLSGYFLKITAILGLGVSSLQQILKVFYLDPQLDSALSMSIPILMLVGGTLAGIFGVIEKSQHAIVKHLIEKYPHYFAVKPDLDLELQEEISSTRAITPTSPHMIAALKHKYKIN
jgi:hypothetical protein